MSGTLLTFAQAMDKFTKNIGILAHVDAGKTTLTENFLFLSGATRQKGSVDDGSAITDSLAIEQKRGISVRSTAVTIPWKGQIINVLDTPGHVDFSAEVERVLRVLDGAVVVLSAVEGVQAHTVSLVHILQEMQIPFLIFINKIDRAGADFESVLEMITQELGLSLLPMNVPVEEGRAQAHIQPFWTDSNEFQAVKEDCIDEIVESDDFLLEQFLEGEALSEKDILASGLEQVALGKMVPVLVGAAKKSVGIRELLDAVVDLLPLPPHDISRPLSALVYKVEHHKLHGRLAHIRVFDGQIQSKDSVFLPRHQEVKNIGVTKKIRLNKLIDVPQLTAGEIGIITGISDIYAGDIVGEKGRIPAAKVLQAPVMTVQVLPQNKQDYHPLWQALQWLDSEDPSLALKRYTESQEFHLRIAGPMQVEILEDQIQERFGIATTFKDPEIIYKERPLAKAEGYVRYWMPKPCWAIMTFLIEPAELGSGVRYESKVRQSDIHQKYQNEIRQTIPFALKQGLKGWEVTDLKITLIQGEDHEMHSRPGDFKLATPMGILRGLEAAGTELLEPMMDFKIRAPEDYLGKISGDLVRMRARPDSPVFDHGYFSLTGVVPAATSLDYAISLSSLTSGKGSIRLQLKGYEPCLDHEGVIRPYKGVSPLDEAKWILHRRGAYKADER